MTYFISEAVGQAREAGGRYQRFTSQSLLVKRVTLPGGADGRHAFTEPYKVWRLSEVLCFTPSLKRCFSCSHRPAQHKATPGPVQTVSE